jgi:DNA-binding XRE family transcriptional regulator
MAEHARVYPLRREPSPGPHPQQPQSPEPPSHEPPPRELPPRELDPREPRRREPQPHELRPQEPRPHGLRPHGPRPQEPLWREVLGERLRALRLHQGETLAETAGRAGISPQYLSEVERGRKEPSSEMIAALAGALGITLTGLTERVAGDLRRQQGTASGPVMLYSLAA